MHVHGDGIDYGGPPATTGSSMNVQLFSQASRDFRWKPSQGITFHKSTSTRLYSTGNIPQKKVPSHGVAPPKKSSVLTTASAASKNTRSTVPVLPYIPRKPSKTQIAELVPKQVNRTPYRGFIDLGNDFDALGQALAEAGVGQDGAKDQTRNTWEPVKFITEKSQAGIHDLSVECIIAKKEQIAAQREEQAPELAARQEENARQVIAQRERDLPKARIVAQRKEQARKLRARQKAKARQVAAQLTIKPREARLAIKPREARLAIKPREARLRIRPGAAYQGGWAKLVRMETLRREKLVKPKQEAAAAEALRKRVEASYTAKTQIEDYEAFKQKFAPVSDGYTDLIEALSGSQDEHPQLKICWLCGIKDMREEFGRYSHLYRHIVRLRKERGKTDESGGKGPPRMSTLWRQRVRHYYLTSPIREQAVLAAMSIHATHSVNTLRRQQRLRPLRIPVKLVENGRACNNEAFEIIAGVIKRDALEADWANQELNRILNPIIDSLKGFQGFLVQLSSLRDFWSKEYPSFSGVAADPVRFGSWQLSYQLERDQTQMMRCFRELEEAVSKRVEKQKQLTKQAQERSAVLLSKYDPSVSDSQSHHKSTTLNLRSTAKLDQASFVGSDSIKQRTSSTKGKDLTPHSANAALPTSDQAQSLVLFRIPEDVKRHTTLVSSSPAPVYWQYTLYRGPDGENVIVHYCKSRETSERIAKLFLSKSVVGFDIEWKPQASAAEGTKKNVSLIQLASAERIALFHIARYGKYETVDDLVAPTLKKIMESPEITKVGVAVKADCTRLRKFMGIDSRGLLELSHLYKLVKFSSGDVKKINKSLVALAQQVEEHLQLPMWKGEVRSSDWSEELNFQQIQYAASDSYAGLQLYNTMEAKRKAIKPMPPCPAHAELNLPIRLANGQTVATYNEPEEMEDESLQSESVSDNDQLPDIEQMAREFLNIAIEDVPPGKVTANSKIKSSPKLKSEKSPEIAAAEVWVADWRSKLPETYKPRATPAYLRAYAVWHEQELGVQETAGLLRDPPLQVTTVSNYILEAIRMEKLPYDLSRLKDVLEHLPESISKSRYQALKRQVE